MHTPRDSAPSRPKKHASRFAYCISIAAIASAGMMAACDTNEPTGSDLGILLEPISGDGQASEIETDLVEPFVVRALDEQRQPVTGATVDWIVREGDGRLSATSSVTDDEGLASATYTLGAERGVNLVEARSSTAGAAATFHAGAFPAAEESDEVYLREDREPNGAFSRFVLHDDETFEYQRAHPRHGYHTREGTYSRAGAELTLRFGSNEWYASGKISSGRLDVTYNINMLLDGYYDGRYVLTKSKTGDGETPADPREDPQHLESQAVYHRINVGSSQTFSRYVFRPSGSFDLEFELEGLGQVTISGIYSWLGDEVDLVLDASGAWGLSSATGLIEGDSLHVEYSTVGLPSAFDPGTYVLVSGDGFRL